MEKWVVKAKKADFQQISADFHIDPVIARLIRNRDVIGDEAIESYLHGNIDTLPDALELKDMEKAISLILDAIREGKRIRIIGDYDIDGIMATYVLLQGLTRLGAEVDTQIPNRVTDGYGLNESLVRKAHEDGIQMIVTCDNGIAAYEQIKLAKEFGMQVIVTDHHEVPYEEEENRRVYLLPPADALINPKQEDCMYPCKKLCGAAVAWKLICGLYDHEGIAKVEKEAFLEFVAVATVGDIMELQGENRILVKEGLKRLQKTKNLGFSELIRVNQLEPEQISTYHIGFVLGPCLNASGRLDTAKRALEMLCAKDREEAARLAGDLKALNDSRKEMTVQGTEAALELVEIAPWKDDRVLVVYLPKCHESLAGIIAGRLKEHYHKPTFVLTDAEEGVKGSGRSIEAYSMYDELCKCKECLTKFGGHPMAAGVSLEKEKIDLFRRMLNEHCALTEEDMVEKVAIDMEMPISYISKQLIYQMELLQPFGMGNGKPLFVQRNLKVNNVRVFGKNRNVAKMQVVDEQGYLMDAVYFGDAEGFQTYAASHPVMMLTYYPGINAYMGRESLQITVQNYR